MRVCRADGRWSPRTGSMSTRRVPIVYASAGGIGPRKASLPLTAASFTGKPVKLAAVSGKDAFRGPMPPTDA